MHPKQTIMPEQLLKIRLHALFLNTLRCISCGRNSRGVPNDERVNAHSRRKDTPKRRLSLRCHTSRESRRSTMSGIGRQAHNLMYLVMIWSKSRTTPFLFSAITCSTSKVCIRKVSAMMRCLSELCDNASCTVLQRLSSESQDASSRTTSQERVRS